MDLDEFAGFGIPLYVGSVTSKPWHVSAHRPHKQGKPTTPERRALAITEQHQGWVLRPSSHVPSPAPRAQPQPKRPGAGPNPHGKPPQAGQQPRPAHAPGTAAGEASLLPLLSRGGSSAAHQAPDVHRGPQADVRQAGSPQWRFWEAAAESAWRRRDAAAGAAAVAVMPPGKSPRRVLPAANPRPPAPASLPELQVAGYGPRSRRPDSFTTQQQQLLLPLSLPGTATGAAAPAAAPRSAAAGLISGAPVDRRANSRERGAPPAAAAPPPPPGDVGPGGFGTGGETRGLGRDATAAKVVEAEAAVAESGAAVRSDPVAAQAEAPADDLPDPDPGADPSPSPADAEPDTATHPHAPPPRPRPPLLNPPFGAPLDTTPPVDSGPLDTTPPVDPHDPLAVTRLGITLRGLRRLRAALRATFGPELEVLSTAEINARWVEALTAPGRCRLLELSGLVPRRDVAPPLYFISHAWQNRIVLLLDAILDGFLEAAGEDTAVWLDVLAVNQHEDTPQHAADIAAFPAVVRACAGGTLVVMDLTTTNPASRAWCMFEWAATLAAHGPDGLHMSLAPADRATVLAALDIRAAECRFPADKERILAAVRADHGSPEAFNAKLRLQLLLEPLSCALDRRRLAARAAAAGTVWDWAPVRAWLDAGPAAASGGGVGGAGGEASRVLCVSGGAGEGKSTVSSLLCEEEELPPGPGRGLERGPGRGKPPGGDSSGGGGGGSGGSGKGVGGFIAASHFLKYNDARRLDPVRLVKSLAFQLATRLPPVCSAVLELDVVRVATLTDPEEAFELLLKQPLELLAAQQGPAAAGSKRASTPSQPSPPLPEQPGEESGPRYGGDASQEPSPPQQQRQQQGVEQQQPFQLVVLIDALDEADPLSLQLPVAGGAAAVGGISGATDGGAPGGSSSGGPVVCGNRALQLVTSCLPRLPPFVRFVFTTRPDAASGQVLPALERAFGLSVTHCSAATLRVGPGSGVAAAAASCSDGAGYDGGGGGVMVYHTAAAALEGDSGSNDDGSAGGQELVVVAAPPQPASSPSSSAVAALKPQLADVYGLYGKIFEATRQRLAGEGEGEGGAAARWRLVSDLVSVVMAAREPLPHSFVQQLGLGDAVRHLPGYPTLFFMDEHHLYTLHKSLGDWLVDPRVSGAFAADVPRGHGLIGLYLAASWRAARGGGADGGDEDSSGGGGDGSGPVAVTTVASSRNMPYTLAYVIAHLAASAAAAAVRPPPYDIAAGNSSSPSTAADALDDLLSDFAFLQAVLAAGHSPAVIGALGGLPPTAATRFSADALRWLLSEQYSLGGKTAAELAADAALRSAPTGTALYDAAVRAAGLAWRTRLTLPISAGDWPAVRAVLKGHADNVTGVVFSPDGRQLLSSSSDGSLRGWDVATGQCGAVLRSHHTAAAAAAVADAYAVAFSPDGRRLASACGDGSVALWDAATGQTTALLRGHTDRVRGIAFSPDGARLASCSWDGSVRVWDAAAAGAAAVAATQGSLVLSPFLSSPAATAQMSVVVAGEEAAARWQLRVLRGHTDRVRGVAFSPDGSRIASSGDDGTVRLWDVAGDNPVKQSAKSAAAAPVLAVLEGHRGAVRCVAFGPMEAAAAAAGDAASTDVDAGNAASAAGGALVLASGSDDANVRIWLVDPVVAAAAAAASGAGARAGSSSAKDSLLTRAWKAAAAAAAQASGSAGGGGGSGIRCRVLAGHSSRVTSVAFSPDGRRLVSGSDDRSVRLWGVAAGDCLAVLRAHDRGVLAVGFSPDGRRVASGGGDHTVHLWDVAAGQRASALRTDGVYSLDFSPDGRQLVSCGEKGVIRLWGIATGSEIGTGVVEGGAGGVFGRLYAVAFSRDGRRIFSAGGDSTVRIWDVASRRCIAVLAGHAAAPAASGGGGGASGASASAPTAAASSDVNWTRVNALAITADGNLLASGGGDSTVRLWDVCDGGSTGSGGGGRCIVVLEGHTRAVNAVAFSATSSSSLAAAAASSAAVAVAAAIGQGSSGHCRQLLLASGSSDMKVRLWDVAAVVAAEPSAAAGEGRYIAASAAPLAVLEGHTSRVSGVAFSPDGRLLASSSDDRTVRLWVENQYQQKQREQEKQEGNSSGGGGGTYWSCCATLQGHTDWVFCLAFSPNGAQVVTGSSDGSVRLWDLLPVGPRAVNGGSGGGRGKNSSGGAVVCTGATCTAVLQGHTHWVNCVAFSPDGRQVVSGSVDQTIRLWVPTGGPR